MKNLIRKILKESDLDYWKDYAERKKKDDERKEKKEDGILGKLLSDTRMDKNENIYTKWFPTRFSVDSLGSEVFMFLYTEFERYCKKNFGLSDREDILELWRDYTNSVIDMIGQPITEVYNIFEEEDFDPFGHITDQNEEEGELEDLGFNLDKDCVLGFSKNNAKLEWALFLTSSWLYLSFCHRM